MDIPAIARLRRVDIGVRIHPNDSHLPPTEPFSDGPRRARDRADGDAVVAAEGEDASPLLGVLVDLLAELARHGADGARTLHVAVVGVGFGDDGRVGVDGVVVV